MMTIRIGYEIEYEAPQPTPMALLLKVHPSRSADLMTPDEIVASPSIPIAEYRDGFGNICGRVRHRPAGSVWQPRQSFVIPVRGMR
jgi:hypothetical protein